MRLIIDTSVAIAWTATQQSTPLSVAASIATVEDGALVPFHFQLELTNALLALERRRRLTQSAVDHSLAMYDDLDLEIDGIDFEEIRISTFALARHYQLTTYDAVYLELALRVQLPLATRDEALATAAAKAGAKLFAP